MSCQFFSTATFPSHSFFLPIPIRKYGNQLQSHRQTLEIQWFSWVSIDQCMMACSAKVLFWSSKKSKKNKTVTSNCLLLLLQTQWDKTAKMFYQFIPTGGIQMPKQFIFIQFFSSAFSVCDQSFACDLLKSEASAAAEAAEALQDGQQFKPISITS